VDDEVGVFELQIQKFEQIASGVGADSQINLTQVKSVASDRFA